MVTQREDIATLKEWVRGHDVAHIQRQLVVDKEFAGLNIKLDTIISNGTNHNGSRRQQYLNRGTAVGSAGGVLGGGGVGAVIYVLLERAGFF